MAKARTHTWLLTAAGGTPRLFELTLPVKEVPVWDPPVQSDRLALGEVWLYVDDELVAKAPSWAEALAAATRTE